MRKRSLLVIGSLFGVAFFGIPAAEAQTDSPTSTTASRPAKTLPSQTSAPNTSPPPSTAQTTGEANQDSTTKQMNEEEKAKVESKGK